MFAQFINSGNGILMTANINSSLLLMRLAAELGREKMTLIRMLDWAKLSDVQIAEERVFNKAYRDIEDALDGKADLPWQS